MSTDETQRLKTAAETVRRRYAEEHDLKLPDCPDCDRMLDRWDGEFGVCIDCDQYVLAGRVEA